MKYLHTIGLEVHVQLKTETKMFCGCGTETGAPPNTNVCPVCLGYPGAMPVMNRNAVRDTILTGLMIGSEISTYSKFDRKSYFYPDMPKNYQITQYDKPFCVGGSVEVDLEGEKKAIAITRIHLEEDVAKSMHFHKSSGVDFNRAGVPLMEIVSEPDMQTAEEAFAFLQALRQIVRYVGVSDCNLEKGNMRCDVNCSVRPEGQTELGTKTELKNLNTFKGVFNAIKYELGRQVEVLTAGGTIQQETRCWDVDAGVTESLRSKENAHDYRYFPEPDLMPVVLTAKQIEDWRKELPELPRHRRERLVSEYGLPDYDAGVIVADKHMADYYEEAAGLVSNPKAVSNWIMTEMLRLLGEREMDIEDVKITPVALAGIVKLVDSDAINSTKAKEVFVEIFDNGGDPEKIVKDKGLGQVSDQSAIEELVDQAISENAKSVEDYRSGKKAALQYIVGQVMRLSKGKANPKMVGAMISEKLG
jgi:aspartyl-tRNA(Asn)/glutamyl-tRNA(Gln) amidotransferase subunit B